MPTINSQGDFIEEAVLSTKEKNKLFKLMSLEYPQDEEIIFHMTSKDFRDWIYLQNPRNALLLCSTYGISQRVKKQMKQTWKRILSNFIWRMCH